MPDERGSTIYAAYIRDQLSDQDARKSSIEQRGIAVITTSGTLVSLLFGLVAVLTGADRYQLPGGAESWLFAAMIFFVVAAVAGIVTNLPLWYIGVKAGDLRSAVKQKWADAPSVAEQRVAATNAKVLERAMQLNTAKGFILLVAITLEVVAVVCLAGAVRVILLS